MEKEELKPCPFCGSKDLMIYQNSEYEVYTLFCNECNGGTSIDIADCGEISEEHITYDEVDFGECLEELKPLIEKWNRRA